MRVSLEWLREYAQLDAPVEQLVRNLVDTGTEVERVGHVAEGSVVAQVMALDAVPESTRGMRLAGIDTGEADPVRVITGAPNVKVGDLVAYGPPGTLLPGRTEPLGVREMFRRYRSPGMLLSAAELGVSDDAEGLLILDRGRPGQPLHEVLPALDVLLDLAITTNRPDCLCHLGIARELAAALGESLHEPDCSLPEPLLSATASARRAQVLIDDPDGCRRFTALVIEGVAIGPSPEWLARRLRAIGLRPINSVVDITNYVTHELGHPLHAFDIERLAELSGGGRAVTLAVRRAHAEERLECLDGQTRELDPADLVIAAGRPVSLAGVIGGTETAIGDGTRAVLLEAATWEPTSIRATARRHGLRTDASALFDKGLPDQLAPLALRRAAALIAEIAGGHILRDPIDEHPAPLPELRPVEVTGAWLGGMLGYPVDVHEAATALARLGFAVEQEAERLTVHPPLFRRDVTIAEDVAEEVGRSLGYDRVPSTLPGRRTEVRHLAAEAPPEERVRDVCIGAGLDEVMPYVFTRAAVAAALPGLAGDRAPMPVLNPLSEEMSHLRLSLLPGLCETLALNLHRGVDGAAIFELVRAFWEGERHGPPAGSTPDGADRGLPPLPAEPLLLGVAIHVDADATQAATEIRRCQALLDRVARELGDVTTAAEPGESPGLRPGRTAWVSAGSTRIGLVGELDPATVDAFDLRGRVVVAELRVDALASAERRLAQYRPVPRFPAVVQDLAVTVPVERRASQGLAVVGQAGGPLLEGVELRDEFRGEQIGAGRKGWTFRLTFRSLERTLVAAEVQPWQDAVMLALRDRLGAEPRT